MADKAWKRTERQVAALLGGTRVPMTGRARGSTPDVTHPLLAVEVKHRKSIPAWLRDAVDQAQASVRGAQLPIVVLHGAGERFDHALVIITLSDFSHWIEDQRQEGI